MKYIIGVRNWYRVQDGNEFESSRAVLENLRQSIKVDQFLKAVSKSPQECRDEEIRTTHMWGFLWGNVSKSNTSFVLTASWTLEVEGLQWS